ncbi:hypothetical protein RhiirA5_504272 [Rhizophagus irregularis]|uniref:Uncharacterized protein n=1 Tax=Rhizophagus irregularis TaxID=588596 RepID=A0A2N0P5B1_9GLOM|nr:hypothetical protein RhiirA5_504272 [Rhizophagus irregularis]
MEKDFLKVEIQNRKGAKRKLNDEIKKQLLDDLLKNAIRLEKKGQDLFSNIGTIKFIRKRLIQHRKLSSWDSTNKDLYLNNFENARLLYIDENLHLEFLFWNGFVYLIVKVALKWRSTDQRVLLLLDNCKSYKMKSLNLPHVEIHFLPLNTTLKIQLMDALVVRMCRGQTKHTESKDEYFASHSVYHFKLE